MKIHKLALLEVMQKGYLRRILAAYTGYYSELRTHLSLGKDSPATGRSNKSASSPQGRSLADYITSTAGCSFR
jgi:hypothetical protein